MIKVGVVYGGKSTEHEVSISSAKSIINNLNREKYEVFPIFINKNGDWYEKNDSIENKIDNIISYLSNLDIVFPILHGRYGEDGTIQGFCEIADVKYVGCKVLSSGLGMDKTYSKIIFEKAKIKQAKYIYVKKYNDDGKYIYVDKDLNENIITNDELIATTNKYLNFPVFVKPSNSGSSVGVNKAENEKELINAVDIAFGFDDKVLIEEGIDGKEVECAVLGNNKIGIEVSEPGEINSAEDYYTYDAKYFNSESKTLIPAIITADQSKKIKELAVKAFKAIDGNGLSRVDFFVQKDTGEIFINEINTMPGFTSISMYPKLFEAYGYTYSELLDRIIDSI